MEKDHAKDAPLSASLIDENVKSQRTTPSHLIYKHPFD